MQLSVWWFICIPRRVCLSVHLTFDGHYLSGFLCSSVCLCVCEDEGESVSFQSLASLAVGEESCIVGTLCKRMDLKPSILKAVTQEVSQQAYCVCPVVMLYCNPSMNI